METPYDDSLENLARITGMDTMREPDSQDMLISKAKEFNTILNEFASEGASDEDLLQLVTDMAAELSRESPYMHRPIQISGLIDRAVKVQEDDGHQQWHVSPTIVEDLTVTSMGFAWRREKEEWEIVHTFFLNDALEVDSPGGIMQRSVLPRGYAGIDTVSIEYAHNPKEASETLEYIAKDLIAEIDEALYNSTSITEAIQRLGEIRPTEIYEDLPSEILRDVASYVLGAIEFDNSVPYEFEINHSFITEDDTGEPFIVLPNAGQPDGGSKRILGYVEGAAFTDGRVIVGNHCIISERPHFALIIRVVHDESVGGEAEYEITALMQDIGYCESLRDLLRAN